MSPTSNLALSPVVITLIDQVHPISVLDVGPGFGKYGMLIREYVPSAQRVDAVEAWPGYVNQRLTAIYDRIYVDDVCNLLPGVLARYDCVLMSEVIEHLDKDQGLELLARIPGNVVITTPVEFFSNGPDLPPTEEHKSLWSIQDFGDRIDVDASQLGGVVVRLNKL